MFIYKQKHPNANCLQVESPNDSFDGPIHVFHSAKVQFFAPSNLCGTGGMYRETIYANPDYSGSPRFDTVLVATGDDKEVMGGLLVARVWLLFSYFDPYHRKDVPCALVTWFVHPDENPRRDEDTGMWRVCPECDEEGQRPIQIIHLDTIHQENIIFAYAN
jgi:hypothetical protein